MKNIVSNHNKEFQIVFYIVFFIVNIVCISCKQMYFDTENISFITEKKSMRSFSHLNNPIVITMPVYQGKGFLGNDEWGHTYKREGDIFVVFDWERNKVFDWAFFEGMHGLSNWRAVELGSPEKYYDAGQGSGLIGCLNPEDGCIISINAGCKGYLLNVNSNNDSIRPRYGLIPSFDYKNGSEYYNINFFDSLTHTYNPKTIELPVLNNNIGFPSLDRDGNYWIAYQQDDKNYLGRYDAKNEVFDSFFIKDINKVSSGEYYCLDGIVNDYAILSDGVSPFYENFIICNIHNLSEKKEIPIPKKISENDFLLRTVFIDNEPYLLFVNDEDGVKVIIYHLNMEDWGFEYETSFEFFLSETVYSRDSRIYLLNSWDSSLFRCKYYDVETKEISDEICISFDEIVNCIK